MSSVLDKRRAGVLLHITSLPSTLGFGSMGRHAYRFVDFLKECDLSVWQVLPIHPLHRVPLGTPHRDFLSPYQPMSAFAGNPMLINLRKLIDKGWLPRMVFPAFDGRIEEAFEYRGVHLKNAYFHFNQHANLHDKQKFNDFVQQHEQQWLRDYALFCALKDFYNGACWWNWQDKGHRNHDLASLQKFIEREDKKHCLNRYYFEQFAFFTQWAELKQYANSQGVCLFGDMPFFMARDSVEVWAHREYFQLDQDGIPLFLSGYPSKNDNFSPNEGQCWGHPLYDWAVASEEDFEWWLNRFKVANIRFDLVRLTHFQGFYQCWAVENSLSINPMNGKFQPTLGRTLFNTLQKLDLPLIFVAEDIGSSEDVWKLRNEFQFHKMKLLQLAFDTKKEDYLYLTNPHLPHNHSARDVAYTGTHDSDTTKGWFFRAGYEERRKFVCSYLMNARAEEMPFPIIRAAFQFASKLAMVPMQDYLGLDGKCRMNEPGTSKHKNWRWQFQWTQITQDVEHKIKELVELYERG